MINNLSKKITKELVKRNILSQDDFELYHYGFFIALSDLWLLTFTIIVGILLKAIVLSLVFFFSFAYKSKRQTPSDAVFSRSDYNNIVITC